jgi:hypothetical protein
VADHLVIDASRQPSQIRCLHCGAAQDLALPMRISELVILEETWRKKHNRCRQSRHDVPTNEPFPR